MLFADLPSGRSLAYVNPRIKHEPKFNKEGLVFDGMDQVKKKWMSHRTYGGRLVENCLAGDTLVLTDRGWVEMKNVASKDSLWDGQEWVGHKGLVSKGRQQTIDLGGVRVTPDHLILTERGWRSASSCEGYNRYEVTLPDGYQLRGFRREKIPVAFPLRLWKRIYKTGNRIFKGRDEVVRVSAVSISSQSPYNSRNVETPGISCLAVNERPLPVAYTSGVGELRRTWNSSLPALASRVREFLGGHGSYLQKRSINRSKGRRRELLSRELPVGIRQGPEPKSSEQYLRQYSVGAHDYSGGRGEIRGEENNPMLSSEPRLPGKPFVCHSGRNEQVYDLLNAGPRHRFVVKGDNSPSIVHNCVQAIARDCLAVSMMRLDNEGYDAVMHVHDEVILDVPIGTGSLDNVTAVMGKDIGWAPGLPLRAAGYECDFYKKD